MLHENRTGKNRKRLGIWLLVLCLCSGFGMEAMAGQWMSGSSHLKEAAVGKSGQPGISLVKGKKKKKNKKNNNNNNNSNNNSNNSAGSNSAGDNNGSRQTEKTSADSGNTLDDIQVDRNGTYTSKMEVAAYIHQFGELPGNFITKNEAKDLGWVNSEGNLDEVAPGKSIGGDYFGNYEGQLPEKKGRKYYECDIDYTGGYRSSKRIIFSSDGYIFYTEDHYTTFEQLYPYE